MQNKKSKKIFILVGVMSFCLLGEVSAQQDLLDTLSNKKILSVKFPLKNGHELYYEYNSNMNQAALFENSGIKFRQIKTAEELAALVDSINTKEEALAYVKFFSSLLARFSLRNDPCCHGVEPTHITDSLASLLNSTSIEENSGQFVIERDLLLYPEGDKKARLVRSKEVVSKAGTYTFTIKQILSEGDQVNQHLPYYD